jgi:two-component system response regulator TctD
MKLLLVEDNDRLSTLLQQGLGKAGFTVDLLTTVSDADEMLKSAHYDIVVLDLNLPDGDGHEVLRNMRSRGDSTPVLVLTARATLKDRVNGLDAGADDYAVKPFALEELIARLNALLRRPGDLLGFALKLGNVTFDTRARQVFVDEKPCYLSARELAVLETLMRRSGRVVPKKILEDNLFGLSDDVVSNAIEVYIHRLRKRLGEFGATVRVDTLRGVGYMISHAAPE